MIGSAELARREERFAPKAAAPAHTKSSEPPKGPERREAHEAEGAAKRSSHSSGSKAPASVPSGGLRDGEGKPVRERREKDREPGPGSDRDSGQARERGANAAGGKSRLSRQDLKAVMPSEKPAQTPAEHARHEADQHQDARHKDPARKARAVAPSKAEAAAKPAAEHDAKKRKPGVELDDLRERALSSRRPAAKQEAPAAAAGVHIVMHMTLSVLSQASVCVLYHRLCRCCVHVHARHWHVKECDSGTTKSSVHAGEKEAPRAAARAISRKEVEPKQTGRAARESKGSAQASGAAEAPNAAKEAAVRASQPGLATHASTPAKSEASSQHSLGQQMWCMGDQPV